MGFTPAHLCCLSHPPLRAELFDHSFGLQVVLAHLVSRPLLPVSGGLGLCSGNLLGSRLGRLRPSATHLRGPLDLHYRLALPLTEANIQTSSNARFFACVHGLKDQALASLVVVQADSVLDARLSMAHKLEASLDSLAVSVVTEDELHMGSSELSLSGFSSWLLDSMEEDSRLEIEVV